MNVQSNGSPTILFNLSFDTSGKPLDLVNLANHGKDISRMVWAAIWRGGRSNLVIMERDETSKKNGYSSKSYIQCLEKELIPIYEPSLIFQQDNAKIHTSLETQEWFENHGIEVMEWPTHSPDLNPIEHC
jgi:hypothetical protein